MTFAFFHFYSLTVNPAAVMANMTNKDKIGSITGGFYFNDILYGVSNADSKVYRFGKDGTFEEEDFAVFFRCPDGGSMSSSKYC